MFIEKVAYTTLHDLHEDFHERVHSTTYYDEADQGHFLEVEVRDNKPALFELLGMDIISVEEAKDLVDEKVAYLMIFVPE